MVDKILARLKKLGTQILEWWKKFARKQKVIIVSSLLGIIAAMIILVTVLSQSKYTFLLTTANSTEGAEVRDILTDASINYKVSSDGCTFTVDKTQEAAANLALGSQGYATSDYSDLKTALSGGFSTTEADKQKYYLKVLETQLIADLESYDFVKKARVNLSIPEDDGTLISKQLDSSAGIILTLKGVFNTDLAANMAKFVATALGNEDTSHITIVDSEGNLYFSGEDASTIAGTANSQLTARQQINNMAEAQVTSVLVGLGEFSSISIAPNMSIDFSTIEQTIHDYSVDDGRTEGYLSSHNLYESESTSGDGGVPGTTSNTDNTSYVLQDNTTSSSTESELSDQYLLDESISYKNIPAGAIDTTSSTIAVTTITYNVIHEEDAKRQGLLAGTNWTNYKLNNNTRTKIDVDQDWINTVSMATGVPAENISFVAYSENWFVDKEGLNIKATDVVTVVLIVLILGLLAFVILRSMKSVRRQEKEEELSVESLLQSTPEPELENIEFEEKSNARRIIEKFVDENPDAVANLLRNWLSEDWG